MAAGKQKSSDGAWPHFATDEIDAVADVLRSGRVNQWTGERVVAFEEAFAERFAMPHAIALANGSLALELALRAFDVGPGDEVIVTSSSFMASASCVPLVGAVPVFADVNRNSQNMTAATVEPLITDKTRAIIPVHLAGWPVDIEPLMELARRHKLFVIEDCAQAHGAEIVGKPAGSFGHAAAFSFCQDKIMTTGGEGGMVLFRDKDPWKRAWSYKDHGKSWEMMHEPNAGPGFRYVHETIGSNWRLTEMQAAIGLVQLTKLDRWLAERRANAAVWCEALAQSRAVRIPAVPPHLAHARYKLCVFLELDQLKPGTTRDDVLTALQTHEIDAGSGFCPEIYLEKAFASLKVAPREVAHALGQTSLMFKVHPTLNPDKLASDAGRARDVIADFEK
ncbi:MAG: DegT/DnrJ/EryC1/StrS family aminotransferase [Hyphomicrobiaceae bacterium]